MTERRPRLVLLGLDSVSPTLLDRFRDQTPRLHALLDRSSRATLESCDPPITVPAWAVMCSGADPGMLGLYGFRHRTLGSYDRMYIPDSSTPRYPMVWDALSRAGRRVAVVGMPPGYPPRSINGVFVSDFLTPDGATNWVTPAGLRPELEQVAGGPFFDVPFRVSDRVRVAQEIETMTRRRWKVIRHLWGRESWDLFALHDIGPDRIHHAFWKYFDPSHPRYVADPVLGTVAGRFYSTLDEEVGRFLDLVGGQASVLVVSDHGSQAMRGCFCINEWLHDNGFLRFVEPPTRPGQPLEESQIDWSRTRVWGAGGYYARLFINIVGREPRGIVPEDGVTALAEELRSGLDSVRTPDGSPLGVRLFRPSDVYEQVQGDPPDLMAYFGGLAWRSAGTVGHRTWFTDENDTGPDDAVHSRDGTFAFYDPARPRPATLPPQSIRSVAPLIYRYFGLPVPEYAESARRGFAADWSPTPQRP